MKHTIKDEYDIRRIVDTYSNTLVRLAVHYTKNPHDADDILQKVYIKYISKQPSFENNEHEKAWLIRVTINECKDMLKSSWWKHRSDLLDFTTSMSELTTRQSDFTLLNEVRKLPLKYRSVIYLYYYEGYKINEISSILSIKENTVSSQLSRGRKKLQHILEGEDIHGF